MGACKKLSGVGHTALGGIRVAIAGTLPYVIGKDFRT